MKLRWAFAIAVVTATLVFACSGQEERSDPGSPTAAATKTARPTPKLTSKPTPAATPAPTSAPTPPPPPPSPAPVASQAAEQGTTSAPPALPGTGPNYYVDDVNGNDGNSGMSEAAAWFSLNKASTITLRPGERLLFKRGGVWAGTLKIEESGAGGMPVVIASYGSGPLPIIQGGNDCIALFGSGIIVMQIQAQGCWAGVRIASGASFDRVEGSVVTGNVAGVHISSGASDNILIGNAVQGNNKMSKLTPSPSNDDSGAFGILLNGDRNEVLHNLISGSDAFSYDYGRDGAAVEVYGGQGNNIRHNVAVDNQAFSELGDSRSRDNTFAYNLVLSSLPDSTFLVTRGSEDGFGPVANTRLFNNTVVMTGAGSQGFVCHAGCNSSILTMRNNIVQAALKAGYADGDFDEDYNIYAGGITQFPLGPHSAVGNPMFNNPGAGDFHLARGSPAVDSGVDAGYTADLEGRYVPHDGNADGIAVADRGAFESN